MEDQHLIKLVLEGKKGAFEQLIKQYENLVATMVYRYVDLSEDREELMQDVFIKVYHSLHSFRQQSKLSTWIATIAYRKSIEFLRKKRLGWTEELEDVKIEDTSATFESKDTSNFVKAMIDKLPPVYATVITLYHIEGFGYEEIADITDIPLGTVKNYIFRARRKLKELLETMIDTQDILYE